MSDKLAGTSTDRLRRLIVAAQVLSSARDPDEVLATILATTVELFAAEGASVALVDEPAGELAFCAMEGPSKTRPFRIPLGQGIAGHVVRSGEPVLSNDVSRDPRFFAAVDARTGFTTASLACVPLNQRGHVIGCMQALNTRQPEGFTADDLELLTALAGIAGAALTRAKTEHATRTAGELLRDEERVRHEPVPSRNPTMQAAFDVLRKAADSNATVLLLGESGVGKEVAARAVHRWSTRAECVFVAINCVALTPTLLESELFGHEKGAFTGAAQRKIGKFELADGGTLFLDEIGDMAPELQTKLLRVLQEREFQRVGGNDTVRCDVRVLAATNHDLKAAVDAGRFRKDLYYRLNVVSVTLPPLRQRREDLPALVAHFARRACDATKHRPMAIDPEAMALIERYPWPGNLRELANVIERATVLCKGDVVTVADLPMELWSNAPPAASLPSAGPVDGSLGDALRAFKIRFVREALDAAGGNQLRAAARLGLHPANLSRLLKDLGLR
jgi:Nif-specific regulatory protein